MFACLCVDSQQVMTWMPLNMLSNTHFVLDLISAGLWLYRYHVYMSHSLSQPVQNLDKSVWVFQSIPLDRWDECFILSTTGMHLALSWSACCLHESLLSIVRPRYSVLSQTWILLLCNINCGSSPFFFFSKLTTSLVFQLRISYPLSWSIWQV